MSWDETPSVAVDWNEVEVGDVLMWRKSQLYVVVDKTKPRHDAFDLKLVSCQEQDQRAVTIFRMDGLPEYHLVVWIRQDEL